MPFGSQAGSGAPRHAGGHSRQARGDAERAAPVWSSRVYDGPGRRAPARMAAATWRSGRTMLSWLGYCGRMDVIRSPAKQFGRRSLPGWPGLGRIAASFGGSGMARVAAHLSVAELEARFRAARDATEARHV